LRDTNVRTEDIKRLREKTGCGVVDAKNALQEAGGDFARAEELARERQQDRPSQRPAGAGAVFLYRHHDGRLGSMIVLACGTDFVARSPLFTQLGEEVALQVAALAPTDMAALLDQAFVKDGSKTVRQLVGEVAARTGENVQVREFCRYSV
jgi:elongation factor Ts